VGSEQARALPLGDQRTDRRSGQRCERHGRLPARRGPAAGLMTKTVEATQRACAGQSHDRASTTTQHGKQ
jgi:hypothetical protein